MRGHAAAPGGVLPGRGVQDWQVLDGAGLVRSHRQGGAGVGPAHPEGNHPVPVSGGHPPPGAGSAEPHHRGGAGERLLLRPGGDHGRRLAGGDPPLCGAAPGHRAGGGGHLRRGACPWRGPDLRQRLSGGAPAESFGGRAEDHFADGAPRPQAGGQRPSQPALRHHGHCGGGGHRLDPGTQPPQRGLRHLLRHRPGHGVPGDGAALPPGDLFLGAALRHLGAAGKAIAPGNAVPGGLYEKGKNLQGRQRRLCPSLQPVRRDAAHRQGAETADEAVAVLLGGPGSALCEPSQQRPPVGGGVLHPSR